MGAVAGGGEHVRRGMNVHVFLDSEQLRAAGGAPVARARFAATGSSMGAGVGTISGVTSLVGEILRCW
ncbi:hypothetical protein [Nocardia carnea]|uniref:hypothetical protein n=1 Tax=Nocardia carnea TaxID=37328 RepID=UPI0024575F12|nr:hypothetical protein [Nocardia carnea]